MDSRNQKILLSFFLLVILVGLFLAGILVGASVFGWKAAQRAGNEVATIQNLKTIAAVEIQYFNTHNRTFGTFDELVRENMLSLKFDGNAPITEGYILRLSLTPGSMGAALSYKLTADPLDDSYGRKHFYLDSASGQIHVDTERGAGPDDPLLDK